MNRNPKRTLAGALALVAAGAVPQRPSEPAGPPSPEVQAAVQAVLASGRHLWLTLAGVTTA